MTLTAIPRGGPYAPDPAELHELDPNTVALYRLQGTGLDAGPNGLDLTETGTIRVEAYHPRNKVALPSSYVRVGNYYTSTDAQLNILGAMTCMCLARMWRTTTSSFQVLSRWGGPNANEGSIDNITHRLALDTSRRLEYFSENGSGTNSGLLGTTVLARQQWYHLAFTRSASGFVKLFINGSVEASGATTLPTDGSNGNFAAGSADTDGQNWQGPMLDLHLIDRELSEAEVAAIAARITPEFP